MEAANQMDVEASTPLKEGKPPSFSQRIAEVSAANPPRENPCGFLSACFGICLAGTAVGGLFCCIGGLLLLELIPALAIYIGAYYRNDCTADAIPMWLIVGGSIQVLQLLLSIIASCCKSKGTVPAPLNVLNQLVSLAHLAWFIGACVVVYRLHPHVTYDPTGPEGDYCHKTPFLFAFWYLTSSFIILGVIILITICACCCALGR